MSDVIDVVIPARNEENTIGNIVSVFSKHPAIGSVWVGLDTDTTDNTATIADSNMPTDSGIIYDRLESGKGQIVTALLTMVSTPYVIFCDADITGLTADHIDLLIADAIFDEHGEHPVMTVGVPDVPGNYPTDRLWAWPWVSGQRCVPTTLVRPLKLHGYLMETQINTAARHADTPVRFEWLNGLKSAYNMSDRRIAEMRRDAAYGREVGLL